MRLKKTAAAPPQPRGGATSPQAPGAHHQPWGNKLKGCDDRAAAADKKEFQAETKQVLLFAIHSAAILSGQTFRQS